jgi:hypothetical protein
MKQKPATGKTVRLLPPTPLPPDPRLPLGLMIAVTSMGVAFGALVLMFIVGSTSDAAMTTATAITAVVFKLCLLGAVVGFGLLAVEKL